MTEKQKIEKVLDVFHEYLKNSDEIEIFWSEKKKCYLCIVWELVDVGEDVREIKTGEEACSIFLSEIFMDQCMKYEIHKMYGSAKMNEEQMKETRDIMRVYLKKLPEYKSLLEEYI